jgi:hypothetical protein
MHGFNNKGELHLPLPQLVTGLLLWHIAIARGLRYSILMHAAYNGIALLLVLLVGNALQNVPQPESAPPTLSASTR